MHVIPYICDWFHSVHIQVWNQQDSSNRSDLSDSTVPRSPRSQLRNYKEKPYYIKEYDSCTTDSPMFCGRHPESTINRDSDNIVLVLITYHKLFFISQPIVIQVAPGYTNIQPPMIARVRSGVLGKWLQRGTHSSLPVRRSGKSRRPLLRICGLLMP
jgi:hypothetical protein